MSDLCEMHGAHNCEVCPARDICAGVETDEEAFELDFVEREKL